MFLIPIKILIYCMIHYTASKAMPVCVKLVQTCIFCGRPVKASQHFRLLTPWCCPPLIMFFLLKFLNLSIMVFVTCFLGLAHVIYLFFCFDHLRGVFIVSSQTLGLLKMHEPPLCTHGQTKEKLAAGKFLGPFIIKLSNSI